jgi:hypothetical protein
MTTKKFARHRLLAFTDSPPADILAVLQSLGIKKLLPLVVSGHSAEPKDLPLQTILTEREIAVHDPVYIDVTTFDQYIEGLSQAVREAEKDPIVWLLPHDSSGALGIAAMLHRREGKGDVIVVVDRRRGKLHLCADGMKESVVPSVAGLTLQQLRTLHGLTQKKYRPFPPFDAPTLERIRATPALVHAIALGGQLAPQEFLARSGFSLTEFMANISSQTSVYRKRALDEFTDWIEYKRESADRPLEKQKPYVLAVEMLNELWGARPIAAALGWTGDRRLNPPRFDEIVMCWGKAIVDQIDSKKSSVVEAWAGLQLRSADKSKDYGSDLALVTRQGTLITFDASAWLGDVADLRVRLADRNKVLGAMGRHIVVLPLFDSVIRAPDTSRILLHLPWICRDLGVEFCTVSEQDTPLFLRRTEDRVERCNPHDTGALECKPFRAIVEEIAKS